MIKQLSQALQVNKELNGIASKTTQFNATLPIQLEVKEKLLGIRYMLKVGNVMLETKSMRDLEIGGKYWAQMAKDNKGTIMLSNLIKQPHLLKEQNMPLRLNTENLSAFLEAEKPFESMKGFLMDRLMSAESKWEFAFLSHMLMSLKHKVLTLPLRYDEEEKNGLMQLKKKKVQEKDSLEFYSVFANLGAVWGVLRNFEDGIRLDISVMYESIAKILEKNLDSLPCIKETYINVDDKIKPLYDFDDFLLNVEG